MTKPRKVDNETGDLSFPNPSRSYDETAHGVRFWGYDRTFEVSFFVDARAFTKINPETRADEAGFLSTFDVNRNQIREAASNVYSRRRKGSYVFSYTLTNSDF